MSSTEELRHLFKKFDAQTENLSLRLVPETKRASVLIPIFKRGGEWRVLLTLRSKHLSSHADTVSFPGGRQDEMDDGIIATALREAEEEIGLRPEDVEVIASFYPSFVRPNNVVTPVLGVIPENFVPKPHDGEVAKVFDLPLARFLRDDYTTKSWSFGQDNRIVVFHFDDFIEDRTITTWGFTATLCIRVALVLLQSPVVRSFRVGEYTSKDNAFKKDSLSLSYFLAKM